MKARDEGLCFNEVDRVSVGCESAGLVSHFKANFAVNAHVGIQLSKHRVIACCIPFCEP